MSFFPSVILTELIFLKFSLLYKIILSKVNTAIKLLSGKTKSLKLIFKHESILNSIFFTNFSILLGPYASE